MTNSLFVVSCGVMVVIISLYSLNRHNTPKKDKPDYDKIYALEKELGIEPSTERGKKEKENNLYIGQIIYSTYPEKIRRIGDSLIAEEWDDDVPE